jgi:hypothetical protein
MAYTLENFQVLLVRRTSAIMAEVSMDTDTTSTANTDLADPLSFALRQIGIIPTDITAPADADFLTVTDDQIDELLDLAEYRLLTNIFQNFDDVDVRIGHRQEEFSQLANRVGQRIDRMRTHIRDVYGYGRDELEAGVIDLDFDTSGDDTIAETSTL